MNQGFDIFERVENDSVRWHGHAAALEQAQLKIQEIARRTKHECFAIHLPTQEIVAVAKEAELDGDARASRPDSVLE